MLADDDHLRHLKGRGLSRADDDHLRHRERRRLGCADDDHLRHLDGRWNRHSRQRGGKTSPHQRNPESAEDRDLKRLGHEAYFSNTGPTLVEET
jgi:hypothetical protein